MPRFLYIAIGGSNGTRRVGCEPTVERLEWSLTFTTGKSRFGRGRECTSRGVEGDEKVVVVSLFVELSGGFVPTFLEGCRDGRRSGRRGIPRRLGRLAGHDVKTGTLVSRPLARRTADAKFITEWLGQKVNE